MCRPKLWAFEHYVLNLNNLKKRKRYQQKNTAANRTDFGSGGSLTKCLKHPTY